MHSLDSVRSFAGFVWSPFRIVPTLASLSSLDFVKFVDKTNICSNTFPDLFPFHLHCPWPFSLFSVFFLSAFVDFFHYRGSNRRVALIFDGWGCPLPKFCQHFANFLAILVFQGNHLARVIQACKCNGQHLIWSPAYSSYLSISPPAPLASTSKELVCLSFAYVAFPPVMPSIELESISFASGAFPNL